MNFILNPIVIIMNVIKKLGVEIVEERAVVAISLEIRLKKLINLICFYQIVLATYIKFF